MVPQAVAAFRAEYRAREVGPRYSGVGHFACTTAWALGAIAVAVSRVEAVSVAEASTVPVSFLVANFFEYLGHRTFMHRPWPLLGVLYRRHTLQHHRFYTHDAMRAESHRDFKMVLFPPVMIAFFLGGIATPIAAALHLVATPNVAWLFVATAVSYFIAYEWLHCAYHLPPGLLDGVPFLAALRRHHDRHHDPAVMGRWNFNITFPITDELLGTVYREPGTRRPLASAVALLALVGATLGPVLDRAHVAVGAIAYPEPRLLGLAWWVPILYAGAVLAIGLSHARTDRLLGRERVPSRARVLAGLLLLGIAWVASGLLPSPWAAGGGLAALAALAWAWLDRTWHGLLLGVATAACGVGVEVLLASRGLFRYLHPEVLGVATWLPWLYVVASVAVGNLGRAVLAPATGRSGP